MRGVVTSGDGEREFGGVSIDTRTLTAGDLFVGVRGDRFDGADFAGDAIAAGAAGVVVPRGWSGSNAGLKPARHRMWRGLQAAVVIEVDDTTAALQALAHAIRKASGTKVVAITGSAGKTTTKEVTASFSRRGTASSATAGISTTTSGCRCRSWS